MCKTVGGQGVECFFSTHDVSLDRGHQPKGTFLDPFHPLTNTTSVEAGASLGRTSEQVQLHLSHTVVGPGAWMASRATPGAARLLHGPAPIQHCLGQCR